MLKFTHFWELSHDNETTLLPTLPPSQKLVEILLVTRL
jgi:hypothetical protein